jgi:Tol biopolymer transport system component
MSRADSLVPGAEGQQVYLRDRQTGKTELVCFDASGAPGNSAFPAVSADGRFVTFMSNVDTPVPGNTPSDLFVFVRDRVTATTEVIGRPVNISQAPLHSYQPAISADGQWLVFVTAGQVFERSRIRGAAALVSASTRGEPANGPSYFPSISADGRFIAFQSYADNLVPGDTNDGPDIFVWDRQTGKTELVSLAVGGGSADGKSYSPVISANGRFVAFTSGAGTYAPGVFVRDRQTATTERLVHGGGSPAISADGRFVAFEDPGSIFVRDRQTGKTELVTVGTSGEPANDRVYSPSISADGRFVAFNSRATNLVPGDTNNGPDIFVRDRQTGKTELVTVAANGVPANGGSDHSPAISADGRFIVYTSRATNLVPGDTNNAFDIFVRDRQTATTERVTVAADDVPANGGSYSPAISADGRFVTFSSNANNLVPGDTNGKLDVFVAERE